MYMYVSLLLVVIKRGLGKCIMHYMQHYYSLHFTYYSFFLIDCAMNDFQDQRQIVFRVMIHFQFL